MAFSRSEQMRRMRPQDTKPEVAFRNAMHRLGYRYRKGTKVEGIRPDLVLRKHNAVVFVDGCFFHGCPVHYRLPKNNRGFWSDKLRANVERDIRQTQLLRSRGWNVIRVLQHDIRQSPFEAARRVHHLIGDGRSSPDLDLRVLAVHQSCVDRVKRILSLVSVAEPDIRCRLFESEAI